MSDLTEKETPAQKYFKAQIEFWNATDELKGELLEIFHPEGVEEYHELDFCEDYNLDYYDDSIDFLECNNDFDLKGDQLDLLWKLGFRQVWISYKNEESKSYHKQPLIPLS